MGLCKAHLYTGKPASIEALEDNIEAFIREIPVEMLERVCHNRTKFLNLTNIVGTKSDRPARIIAESYTSDVPYCFNDSYPI